MTPAWLGLVSCVAAVAINAAALLSARRSHVAAPHIFLFVGSLFWPVVWCVPLGLWAFGAIGGDDYFAVVQRAFPLLFIPGPWSFAALYHLSMESYRRRGARR